MSRRLWRASDVRSVAEPSWSAAMAFPVSIMEKTGKTDAAFRWDEIAGKDLNKAQLTELLTDGMTKTIRGFKSKSGKKFDACLKLEKDENGVTQVRFDFDHVEAKKIKDVVCPLCGGEIVKTPFGYGCANYSSADREQLPVLDRKNGGKKSDGNAGARAVKRRTYIDDPRI